MIRIAPSILSADFMRLGEEIRAVEQSGAHMLHIDIMDGNFVPNITVGYAIVESIKKITSLPLDVHLMIDKPEKFIKEFIDAGAHYLTVHYEASVHLHRTINWIQECGIRAGVSINPSTPVRNLEDILHAVDLVLIMSVNPGFGGQQFIPHSIEKIKLLAHMAKDKGLSPLISVDGGIKPENAKKVADAGAGMLVMGSAFFAADDYGSLMGKLNALLGNR